MATTDHPARPAYKAALERLARAGVRMEAARMMNAPDLAEVEADFLEVTEAHEAVRERLAQPGPSLIDGAPLPRAWLGRTELTIRTEAAGHDEGEAEPAKEPPDRAARMDAEATAGLHARAHMPDRHCPPAPAPTSPMLPLSITTR